MRAPRGQTPVLNYNFNWKSLRIPGHVDQRSELMSITIPK
jgi:hypothetical protein